MNKYFIGFIVGFFFCLGLVFLIERLFDRISTPRLERRDRMPGIEDVMNRADELVEGVEIEEHEWGNE